MNKDTECTDYNLGLQPKALLKMFAELGRRAQEELERRSIEEWGRAEHKFAKKMAERNAKIRAKRRTNENMETAREI